MHFYLLNQQSYPWNYKFIRNVICLPYSCRRKSYQSILPLQNMDHHDSSLCNCYFATHPMTIKAKQTYFRTRGRNFSISQDMLGYTVIRTPLKSQWLKTIPGYFYLLRYQFISLCCAHSGTQEERESTSIAEAGKKNVLNFNQLLNFWIRSF